MKYMEQTTQTTTRRTTTGAATNALALVGVLALIGIGILLAIYAARNTSGFMQGAAVTLSSIFRPADDASLNVVEGPSSFLVEEQATSTTDGSDTDRPIEDRIGGETPTTPSQPTTGTVRTRTVVTMNPVAPYGDTDLLVRITDVGYLRTSDTDSFVASREVPRGKRGAVKFTVVNAGTNVTGRWDFEAKLPTASAMTYKSSSQRSLNPGDEVDFILGFDRPKLGDDRQIVIRLDTDNDVKESNERNNSDSATIDFERN